VLGSGTLILGIQVDSGDANNNGGDDFRVDSELSPTLIMRLAVGPCHNEDISAYTLLHLVRGALSKHSRPILYLFSRPLEQTLLHVGSLGPIGNLVSCSVRHTPLRHNYLRLTPIFFSSLRLG
jgi:hypothetical protein